METSAAESSKTPAQLMQEQHEAAAKSSHKPTVEDTVDQEDIDHPPPSHTDTPIPTEPSQPTNGVMSAKAAGKQKASEKLGVFDTTDEEAFPSLAPASKPAAKPTRWGANPAIRSAKPNGTPTSRPTSSGATTPSTPGVRTPMGANSKGGINLPGRYRDEFEIENRDLDKTKTIKKVLDDTKKKYNVTVSTQPRGYGNKTAFVAEGIKQSSVTEALMFISKLLTVDKVEKIEIPTAIAGNIIGKQGAGIRKLEAQFNVRINLNKEERDSDAETRTVVITGHAAGVRQVYEHISKQVKQLQPKVDIPLRDIPPELFPFLAGQHGPKIQRMQQDRDLQIDIPAFYRRQQLAPTREEGGPLFAPHGTSYITISGEQDIARQAQQELQRLAQQLQDQLVLEELTAEQILHPYIVGDRGIDPLEFLKQTGCAIVLPPPGHDTDEVHVVGPQDRIEGGLALANELMSKKHTRAVDLQKQYQDAPQGHERHSRALASYLQRKAIDREFERSHNAEILFPRSVAAGPSWNIMTDDPAKAMAARNELAKIAQAYPTPRLQLVEIDPFFHPHLEDLHASPFEEMGVHMIVPDNGEDPVVLVYEGPSSDAFAFPRTKPTPGEIRQFEKALQEAEAQLMASIPHQGISQSEINVPRKHHDRVRKFTNNRTKPTRENSFPVQIDFDRQRRGDQIFLRGPDASDIAELEKAIEQFMIEVEQDEKERAYTTTFDFPEKFNRYLIGAGGKNITALREKHDVEIETNQNGQVKIQGPPKKAEACKAEILKSLKTWEDEVNYIIKIDTKWHGMLVGKGGENLRKLQSQHNNLVRIDFPRAQRMADDASVADTASEVGGPRQGSDEIKIRGPRAKADDVRSQLLDLAKYYEDSSYEETVSVDSKQLGSLIGRGGAGMERLRIDTGAAIDIPKNTSGARVSIKIRGSKQQVVAAKKELESKAKEFDSIVTKTIEVDQSHHKDIIGAGGSNIQGIVARAGGTESSAQHVKFPKPDSQSNTLTIRGTQDVVDKIIASITGHVDHRDSQTSEIIDIPTSMHGNLIGPGGTNLQKLKSDFDVTIRVPRKETGQTGVTIMGAAENIARAKEHIQGSTSGQKGDTIQVPRKHHHALDRDGRFKRDLERMGISIDHQGQKPPKKPQYNRPNQQMPLITDDDAVQHTWNLVPLTGDDEGEIPWVIWGKDEKSLATAKSKIEAALEEASKPQFMGLLTLADQRLHNRIVGPQGKTINGIRKETGCDVQVPKGGDTPITVRGGEEGVNEAFEMIMEAVERRGGR